MGHVLVTNNHPNQISTTQLHNTSIGRQVTLWVDAVNSDNPERALELDERALDLKQTSGGVKLVRIEENKDDKLTALLTQHLTGNYIRITWRLDADRVKFKSIYIRPALPPTGLPTIERVSDAKLKALIHTYMLETDFSGAVLFARKGEPRLVLVQGLSDRESGAPITRASLFRIGSMNKMFTAVAVLQLVQKGIINLNAPIGNYLPDYPNKEVSEEVTIHQLLTHTGGTGDIFGPDFDANQLKLLTHQDYIDLYGARSPEFPPGTDFRYSNYGFVLLGRIIETMSGETYYDYVKNNILSPVNMNHTGFEFETTVVPGRVTGYVKENSTYKPVTGTLKVRGSAAGGAYSNVDDMLLFAKALTEHKLLNEKFTELLTTRKANGSYAFGFVDYQYEGLRIIGHEGGHPGQEGDFRIIENGQAVIVVLSNVAPPFRSHQLMQYILDRGEFYNAEGQIAQFFPWLRPFGTTSQRMSDFRSGDSNGDMRLTRTEFSNVLRSLGYSAQIQKIFDRRDENGDELVTWDEYEKALPFP